MIERDPIGNDARRRRHDGHIGPEAACALCGLTNADVLRGVDGSALEFHHAAGKVNDPKLGVVLCANCHRQVTADQHDAGVILHDGPDRSVLDRHVSALRSLGAFFSQLGHRLCEWADELAA